MRTPSKNPEIEICNKYSEVLKSKDFDDILSKIIEKYASGLANPEIVQDNLLGIFIKLIHEKPIGSKGLETLKQLKNDEKFDEIAKQEFENIGRYKGNNRTGVVKFIKMFHKKVEKEGDFELETDFQEFFDFLIKRAEKSNSIEFGKNTISGKIYSILALPYELIFNGNKFISFKDAESKITIYNKETNTIAEKYRSVEKWVSNEDVLPKNLVFVTNTETDRIVLFDSNSGEEVFDYPSRTERIAVSDKIGEEVFIITQTSLKSDLYSIDSLNHGSLPSFSYGYPYFLMKEGEIFVYGCVSGEPGGSGTRAYNLKEMMEKYQKGEPIRGKSIY